MFGDEVIFQDAQQKSYEMTKKQALKWRFGVWDLFRLSSIFRGLKLKMTFIFMFIKKAHESFYLKTGKWNSL